MKGPVARVVMCGSTTEDTSSDKSESSDSAVSLESWLSSCNDPLLRRFDMQCSDETSGKFGSNRRVMAARCEPASTANTDPFTQFFDIERTRKPVTSSSLGPPPEA